MVPAGVATYRFGVSNDVEPFSDRLKEARSLTSVPAKLVPNFCERSGPLTSVNGLVPLNAPSRRL